MSAMLWAKTFLTELHAWQGLGIFVARLAVGLLFFLSGRGKLFLRERREQMRQTLIEAHVPFPELNAVFVSTVEFACGSLLVLGAPTPVACTTLGCLMIVAITNTGLKQIRSKSLLGWLSEFL
jgi:putative oxidoreductase